MLGEYSQWNSHLIGIMIRKTIGFRGTRHFQTHPFSEYPIWWTRSSAFCSMCFCWQGWQITLVALILWMDSWWATSHLKSHDGSSLSLESQLVQDCFHLFTHIFCFFVFFGGHPTFYGHPTFLRTSQSSVFFWDIPRLTGCCDGRPRRQAVQPSTCFVFPQSVSVPSRIKRPVCGM